MGDVGAPELLIILAVILVMFGGAKLPELARSLGKAKREFHKGIEEGMPGPDQQTVTVEPEPLEASHAEHPATDASAADNGAPIEHSG